MSSPDPVQAFFQTQGCSRRITEAGLPGLVATWEVIVAKVAGRYPDGLEEYLNDMDTRDLLEGAWNSARPEQRESLSRRLAAADARIQKVLVPLGRCLWGPLAAEDEAWKPDIQWWYFSRPIIASEALLHDLDVVQVPKVPR